jgi:hypothetical protein
MKRAFVAVALVLGSGAVLGQAQFYTGNKLHEWAQSQRASFNGGMLYGYVMGVHDALREERHFCIPPQSVQVSQMVDVVVNYLAENPASRHEDADVLVRIALGRAWPCPKAKP